MKFLLLFYIVYFVIVKIYSLFGQIFKESTLKIDKLLF